MRRLEGDFAAGAKLKAENFATIQAVAGLSCMQFTTFSRAAVNRRSGR